MPSRPTRRDPPPRQPVSAADVAPGSTIAPLAVSGDPWDVAAPSGGAKGPDGRPLHLSIQASFGCREDCVATLERVFRARLAGRITDALAKSLAGIAGTALAAYASAAAAKSRRASGRDEAESRAQADPDNEPEPQRDPPVGDPETEAPSFEDLVRDAARVRAARETGRP